MLEWTPEEASLLQDRPSLAVCCSVSLHLKGTWEKSLGDSQLPVLGTRGPRDRSRGGTTLASQAMAPILANSPHWLLSTSSTRPIWIRGVSN